MRLSGTFHSSPISISGHSSSWRVNANTLCHTTPDPVNPLQSNCDEMHRVKIRHSSYCSRLSWGLFRFRPVIRCYHTGTIMLWKNPSQLYWGRTNIIGCITRVDHLLVYAGKITCFHVICVHFSRYKDIYFWCWSIFTKTISLPFLCVQRCNVHSQLTIKATAK